MKKMMGLVMISLFLVMVGKVWASGFHISSIGGVDTGGQMLSHWWNTSLQPTIRGEALPGQDILVTIDGTAVQIAADSAGDWFYTPASALTEGDHTISLESNGSTISFSLTLGAGSVDWDAVGSGASETLPTVGIFLPTVIMTSLGSGLVVLGRKLKRQ